MDDRKPEIRYLRGTTIRWSRDDIIVHVFTADGLGRGLSCLHSEILIDTMDGNPNPCEPLHRACLVRVRVHRIDRCTNVGDPVFLASCQNDTLQVYAEDIRGSDGELEGVL